MAAQMSRPVWIVLLVIGGLGGYTLLREGELQVKERPHLHALHFQGAGKYRPLHHHSNDEKMFVRLERDGQFVHEMHVLEGGSSEGGTKPTFLLIHGGSQRQTAEYWTPHFEFLKSYGRFYAVDLFGHGASTGGGSDKENMEAILKLIRDEEITENLILIGRSAGGRIVMNLLSIEEVGRIVHKVVLIAPTSVNQGSLGANVAATKELLLFWAEFDNVINIANAENVMEVFGKARFHKFPDLKTHVPELQDPAQFQAQLATFLP